MTIVLVGNTRGGDLRLTSGRGNTSDKSKKKHLPPPPLENSRSGSGDLGQALKAVKDIPLPNY